MREATFCPGTSLSIYFNRNEEKNDQSAIKPRYNFSRLKKVSSYISLKG